MSGFLKNWPDYRPEETRTAAAIAQISAPRQAPIEAQYFEDGHGGARIVMGGDSVPYANAGAALRWLEALEARGQVRIMRPGGGSC